MPTRSGRPYLLGEPSDPHPDTMDPQFTQILTAIADIMARLDAMQVANTENQNELHRRLEILEEDREHGWKNRPIPIRIGRIGSGFGLPDPIQADKNRPIFLRFFSDSSDFSDPIRPIQPILK